WLPLGSLRSAPKSGQQLLHLRVVLLQFVARERKEIVPAKERLAGLGEVFHRVGHGVGALPGVGAPVAEPALYLVVRAACLRMIVGRLDFQIVKATWKHPVMIRVREFVQGEIR